MANNNGNMFDPYDFGPILSQIMQNFENNGGSLSNNEFTQDLFKKLDGIFENVNELSKKDINKSFDIVLAMLRNIYGNSSELTNAMKMAKDEVKALANKQAVSDKLMTNMLTGVVDRILHASEQAAQKGEKGALNVSSPKDKAMADKLGQVFQTELQKTADSIFDKFSSFFRDQENEKKTKTKHFVDDLIDGLGKSKFIGGAFTDLIRLVTLFAASWLKDKGPLGKALAVGLVALGPIIATAIVNALGKLAGNLVMGVVTKIGSVIGNTLTSVLTKIIGQAGGGVAGNLLTNLLGKGATSAGASRVAGFALGRAVTGTATNAIASGLAVGGADAVVGLGTAGATAVGTTTAATGGGVLALLGPILAIVAGVAAIGTAVYLIVKNWESIKKWFSETKDKLSELGKTWIDGLNDWLDDHPIIEKALGGAAAIVGGPAGYRAYKDMRGTPSSKVAYKSDKLEISKDGSVLNLDSLSQKEAAVQMERYREEHPQEFDNLYEITGSKYAHMVDFQNDLKMRDLKNGGQEGAVLYKGASQDLDNLRDRLIKQGMSQDKVNALLFTSGMSTLNSPHKKGKWKSHSNQYGFGFDLAGTGWSSKDYETAIPVIKDFYKDKGLEAKFEAISGFTDPSKDMRNAHIDVKPIQNMMAEGAKENKEAYLKEHKEEIEAAKDRKKFFEETAKKTIAIRSQELNEAQKKALEDDKIDENEKKVIEEKERAWNIANQDRQTITKMSAADFTGNEVMSSVLKDSLNLMHCQPKQQ